VFGIVSIVFGVIELLVGFRFLFLLFGANSASTFVQWVYQVSGPLVAPFEVVFGHTVNTVQGVSGSVFEIASLLALIVYGVIGGIVLSLYAPNRHI